MTVDKWVGNVKNVKWLLAALLVAVSLKTLLLLGDVVPFNSDEAIVALMARHILQGERPVFFYGQVYMGSLDAFLVAVGFWLLGEHVWVIRLVQTILYSGTLITTAWLGKAVMGSWRVGVLAVWMLAVPTVNTTLYTTATLGGYGEMLLIGNLIILVGLKITKKLDNGDWNSGGRWWLAWGFLSGLGVWVFGLTLVYSLPIGVFLVWKFAKRLVDTCREGWDNGKFTPDFWNFAGKPPLVGLGILLGANPWLIYAYRFGFKGLLQELGGGAIAGVEGLPWAFQIFQHTFNLLLLGSTVIFGLRPPWGVRWLGLPLLPFVLFFWLAVLVYIFRRMKAEEGQQGRPKVLVGVGLALVAGFVFTPFGADPSGRYFLPLAIVLALFAGDMILWSEGRWGKWAWGLAGLVLVYNVWGTVQSALSYPPGITTQFDAVTQIDHRYDRELVDFLRSHEERRGYTNYWVAYPLAFLSQEELIFVPSLPYHQDFRYTERDNRYAPFDKVVDQANRVAYITSNHPALDEYLRRSLSELGVAWNEVTIGDYHIYYQLSRVVRPEEIGLGRISNDDRKLGSGD